LGDQYIGAATCIGPNIEDAQSAESPADFVHKYGIAQKEARESLYRLRLIEKAGLAPLKLLSPLLAETDELIAVITAIVVRTKNPRT